MRAPGLCATMATVATMIMIPQDHCGIAALTTVTMDPGPPVTVAIVATVACGSTEGGKPFVLGAGARRPARVKGSRPFGTR